MSVLSILEACAIVYTFQRHIWNARASNAHMFSPKIKLYHKNLRFAFEILGSEVSIKYGTLTEWFDVDEFFWLKKHQDFNLLALGGWEPMIQKYSPNGGETWWFTMVYFGKKQNHQLSTNPRRSKKIQFLWKLLRSWTLPQIFPHPNATRGIPWNKPYLCRVYETHRLYLHP